MTSVDNASAINSPTETLGPISQLYRPAFLVVVTLHWHV